MIFFSHVIRIVVRALRALDRWNRRRQGLHPLRPQERADAVCRACGLDPDDLRKEDRRG